MSLTIYGIAASRAVRPLWAATELGLAYDHVPLRYQEGATRSAEFRTLNPNGHIPVLVDKRPEGKVVLWESMACTLYLARYHGKPDGVGISPATPEEDAQALRWSFWAVTELEKDALTVLMHRRVMPEAQRKSDLAAAAERRLNVPLAVLEAELRTQHGRGRDWLAGTRFTVADLCVASVLAWAMPARTLLAAHPLSAQWLVRCLARPAQQAMRELARQYGVENYQKNSC